MPIIEIKNKFAHYPCGCKFEVSSTDPVRLKFDPRVENVPLTCPATWGLLSDGNTKGVFQLETRFGQQYTKKLRPENIEQLAALTAILRPGCLVLRGDKNIAEHYIDRKNEEEEVEYLHPALEPILNSTYGEMIYQEQAMKIAQDIAGFNLQQADILRKAIGKKKADIMAQVKDQFLSGCNDVGAIDEDTAKEIFKQIESSQRYSFNKCLDPSSIVETPTGHKALDEIEKGDLVLAPKNNSEDEFVEVLDTIDCGEKEVYEIELSGGDTLTCTLDHKILCSDGKKHKLSEIIDNDLEIMVYN